MPGGPMDANYTYVDSEGDAEDKDQTQIAWYRNGAPVPELANKRSVSNQDIVARRVDGAKDNLISRGQEWFFTVRPSDGRAFGPLAVSAPITIANQPPVATNAKLKSTNATDPLKFTSSDAIFVEFDYADRDEDELSGTIYSFYVNGIQVKTGTENSLSPTEEDDAGNKFVAAGKSIRADVAPSDGRDFGPMISTNTVTVESSPPRVSDVSVLPTKPSPVSALVLSYKFVSLDKNPDQSRTAWFANDQRRTDFDNLTQVPRGTLRPGQKWYAIVTPYDGSTEGESVKSNAVLVQY